MKFSAVTRPIRGRSSFAGAEYASRPLEERAGPNFMSDLLGFRTSGLADSSRGQMANFDIDSDRLKTVSAVVVP